MVPRTISYGLGRAGFGVNRRNNPEMLVPILGVWLRQRYGSLLPLFVVASAGQLVGAALLAAFGRVTCPADDPDWEKKQA